MKITNLNTGFNGNNQYGKPVKESEPMPNHTPGYRKASGGEDFLEISDEAVKKHREAKIFNFTEALIKKENAKSGHQSKSLTDDKPGKISDAMKMVQSEKYNFDDLSVLSETAERLLAFLG